MGVVVRKQGLCDGRVGHADKDVVGDFNSGVLSHTRDEVTYGDFGAYLGVAKLPTVLTHLGGVAKDLFGVYQGTWSPKCVRYRLGDFEVMFGC